MEVSSQLTSYSKFKIQIQIPHCAQHSFLIAYIYRCPSSIDTSREYQLSATQQMSWHYTTFRTLHKLPIYLAWNKLLSWHCTDFNRIYALPSHLISDNTLKATNSANTFYVQFRKLKFSALGPSWINSTIGHFLSDAI